jgi:signal transduction histidine kinase
MSRSSEEALLLDLNDERRAFLSATPAGPRDRQLALWTLAVSTLVFLALLPFAKVQLAPYPAFIPAYQSALALSDAVTALLLFAQFRLHGSRAIVVLAAAYLYTALMAVAHALTFPGLAASGGLFGAGPQSTAWMYMFWHAGFPVLLIAYAFLKREPAQKEARHGGQIALAVAGVLVAAVALTALATAGHAALPSIMQGNRYTPAMIIVVSTVCGLSALALLILWRRPPHTVLDLWLMVVAAAWIFDIGLAAVFNGGRYDLGFYAGRIYGLLAACFVLAVLLVENGALYRRLLGAYAAERDGRQRLQEKSAELAAANKELDAFSYSVSHDLRAPLRAVDGYGLILLEDYGERLDAEGKRLLGEMRAGAKTMNQLIEDLLEFSRVGRREVVKAQCDMAAVVREAVSECAGAAPRTAVQVGELPSVPADRALIRQVWLNLVGNALKYSGQVAEPRVEIGCRREPGEVVFHVRDNGAGFDMKYAQKLFGVFQRMHGVSEFPGTGVGLAIVHRIVTRHGGRVWADAAVGKGATFYFSLPEA